MSPSHLTDAQIQGLADGTLRGPEGLAAREHCEDCVECGPELSLYTALATRLSALRDPAPPSDFTALVLAQASLREAQHAARRQTVLAAIPAVALAMVAIVGWGLSTALQVDKLIESVTFLRTVFGVLGPVFAATRIYLGAGAFVFLAVVLTALSRTLRPLQARAAES